MRPIALALALLPTLASADDWRDLTGPDARAALAGRSLVYESGATQAFRASGKTLYDAGTESWGNWRIEGGRYCSQWPPSDLWACYDLEIRGQTIRFIGSSGDVTTGRYDN